MKLKKEVWWYIVGAVLLVVSFIFDNQIVSFVQLMRGNFLDYVLKAITEFGHMFVVLFIVSALFLWEEKKREWIPTIWVSFFITAVLVLILKLLIARERPLVEEYILFTAIVDYSFPSLHAAAAFTALPVLNKEFSKIKWFWILFALLVVFSRVYLGVHYLSDVIFGAMVGYGVGWLMVYLEDKKRLFRRWIWR